jgi:hypothetical protein
VLKEAGNLQADKVKEYGADRYSEEDPAFAMSMVYSDVYRKFIRLRQLSKTAPDSPEAARALRDCLMDLGNYAFMGVQEIDRFNLTGEQT